MTKANQQIKRTLVAPAIAPFCRRPSMLRCERRFRDFAGLHCQGQGREAAALKNGR
ncbi:hypothetical protein [Bradyrhizobium sp. BR 10261]|uniref:hypothetical protein n=1 Tax=Bradyrhizobium sp. BR 10261 TaxID=2749992 RepID=UPI001C648C5E|nr:hypothetical protein [Bradyrhizobium sp. BR 10261]MBW7962629.1 hypothetical protein [Bradyrhizobium sp. BR 10261]